MTSDILDTGPVGNGERSVERGPNRNPLFLLSAAFLLIAICGAGYLAAVSIMNGAVAGCGPNSGCSRALSSRWGYWLGVPVSLPALIAYSTLLVGVVSLSRQQTEDAVRLWSRVIVALSMLVFGAALWFVLLQAAVIHAWCKVCLGTHLAACTAGAVLLAHCWPTAAPVSMPQSSTAWMSLACAGILLTVLAGGQLAFKARLYRVGLSSAGSGLVGHDLNLYHGKIKLDPADLPLMGSASATNLIVSAFDYTCSHCRALHGVLRQIERRFSGKVAIITLPVPLDALCNPLILLTAPANENACEYARLGLAVWHARPEAFEEFDNWMFSTTAVPSLEEARARARDLVGRDQFVRALSGGWVAAQLQTDVQLYEASSRASRDSRLPILVIGDTETHGAIDDLDDLTRLIEQHLHVTADQTTAGGTNAAPRAAQAGLP
jgi:uncharacterized membrane protein